MCPGNPNMLIQVFDEQVHIILCGHVGPLEGVTL
jgi:hypothetical protein